MSHWWVVVVSLTEYKEEPEAFWNILIHLIYNGAEILLLSKGDDLWECIYFFMFLWLNLEKINFIKNPVSEDDVKKIIDSTLIKINEENKKFQEQQKLEEVKERKKYEESSIKDWLRIINLNIDHIEQVLKAWKWIISWNDAKKLDEYLNEMKKIRLWTNFNKMASLILDVHGLLKKVEEEIFKENDSYKFLIDKNSSVTNIDVLREYFYSNKISEKAKLQPAWLTTSESIENMFWRSALYLKLLNRDIWYNRDKTSFEWFFGIVINLIEYIIILVLVILSLLRLFGSVFWIGNFSIYLLPALWWLWFLVYLLNNLELKWVIPRIVWFAVLILIYWQGLTLLLNTFSL